MNFSLHMLALSGTALYTIIALVALAVIGIIIGCAVFISHKRKTRSQDSFTVSRTKFNISQKDTDIKLPQISKAEQAEEQIPESVQEEAVQETIFEETAEQPEQEEVIEETVAEPAEQEEAVQEVIEEVMEMPVTGEVVEEEIAPQPEQEEAVEEEIIEAPVQETIFDEIVAEQPEQEEIIEEIVEQPVQEEVVEEIVEQPVQEQVTEQSVAEEQVIEQQPVKEQKPEHVAAPVIKDGNKVIIRVRYNRSYTAKIIQSNDVTKNYYSEIKNELMRYGVTDRISWRHETFRKGRKLLVRLAVRGKTLNVYFALNPENYADTKYKVADVSAVAKNADVPTLYKIKNDRRCRYAKQLIADVMAENGLTAVDGQMTDYAAQYPYEELEPLIEKKLVKLLPWKETVADSEVGEIAVPIEKLAEEEIAAVSEIPPEEILEQVSVDQAEEILPDEKVVEFVAVGEKLSDKTKKAIINIDTLGRYFRSGEQVTLAEIKKRVPGIGKKVTYIKVLARGTLDKALTVEADDFSPAAVKMIVLTGGKVIRTKLHN